ncbi:hypothetical protein GJ496_008530 [Pomphorhynchus laevis]|nr:hypothetical protein GJ496_008530 [Pomphorhynchus laevis]
MHNFFHRCLVEGRCFGKIGSCYSTSDQQNNPMGNFGYKILKCVGCGSSGIVNECSYKEGNNKTGTDSKEEKRAIKIINKKKAGQKYINKFVRREIKIHPNLIHPNIIQIYRVHETITEIYICMEWADSGDLLDFIKQRGHLNEIVSRKLFRQILSAVKYCHKMDIAHRDLKCENMLLDKHLNIKIADFGFTRYCYDEKLKKRVLSKTFCGSVAYAAPEILNGQSYNPKLVDIWSIGVVLFIMMTGQMPFVGDEAKRSLDKSYWDRAKNLWRIESASFWKLIEGILEKDVLYRISLDFIESHPWVNSEN